MSFSEQFLNEIQEITKQIDRHAVESAASLLESIRLNGRLFILGVGGSAANASHAVNDFRKITGIEAYAPTDNVSELTARTNDEGWATVFAEWLKGSRLNEHDALLILSVGGGNVENNISANLVTAMQLASERKSKIIAIVGRDGGYAAKIADVCILIPTVNSKHITPHTEAFQAIVWHLLVSHPILKQNETRWESVSHRAVFFDRDGTLNKLVQGLGESDPRPPHNLIELEIYSDAKAALTVLKEKGFKLIVVTNQPDIGRGILLTESVNLVNKELMSNLPLDKVYFCPHSDEHKCECRKPLVGMFRQAASDLNIDLKKSYMVGDTWRDMQAGLAAGCKTVLVYPEAISKTIVYSSKATVSSLTEAANWILKDTNENI